MHGWSYDHIKAFFFSFLLFHFSFFHFSFFFLSLLVLNLFIFLLHSFSPYFLPKKNYDVVQRKKERKRERERKKESKKERKKEKREREMHEAATINVRFVKRSSLHQKIINFQFSFSCWKKLRI